MTTNLTCYKLREATQTYQHELFTENLHNLNLTEKTKQQRFGVKFKVQISPSFPLDGFSHFLWAGRNRPS